jgi:hypothetical protein
MTIENRLCQFPVAVRRRRYLLAGALAVCAGEALARAPTQYPSHRCCRSSARGVVAGIIAYRIKNKK